MQNNDKSFLDDIPGCLLPILLVLYVPIHVLLIFVYYLPWALYQSAVSIIQDYPKTPKAPK